MSILIYIPYSTNIGYAISPLESTFYQMAKNIFTHDNKIHFLYKDVSGGTPKSLPDSFSNIISLNDQQFPARIHSVCNYIQKNSIKTLFGLDLTVRHLFYKPFRSAGLKKIIAYWGAPMSDISSFSKLLLKKIEVSLNRYKPDHFIFESNIMARFAISGRGIPASRVSVVNLGVDTARFSPSADKSFAYSTFKIPSERQIIFYSGHMEERKGVHILLKAASTLVNHYHRNDVHFLIAGNKNGDEARFFPLFKGTTAEKHITFAGYRDDIHQIIPCCYTGVIASSGWDSFPRSALEMASCGLPLVVSNLHGLPETIENNITGFLFNTADHLDLCAKIMKLLDKQSLQKSMSYAARTRMLQKFTFQHQIDKLTGIVNTLINERKSTPECLC